MKEPGEKNGFAIPDRMIARMVKKKRKCIVAICSIDNE
jgi:hypothetical protein